MYIYIYTYTDYIYTHISIVHMCIHHTCYIHLIHCDFPALHLAAPPFPPPPPFLRHVSQSFGIAAQGNEHQLLFGAPGRKPAGHFELENEYCSFAILVGLEWDSELLDDWNPQYLVIQDSY